MKKQEAIMGNVYALVLAGGSGQRMGNIEKPKQFISLCGKPVIIHTVEKFCMYTGFEKIIVLVPGQWLQHTCSLLKKYIPWHENRVEVAEGGDTRNETLMNGIRYIKEADRLDSSTVIVTHDAVRPFVTMRIIEDNVAAAREYGACDTVIPATDTIVTGDGNNNARDIPDRRYMYQGQTPQSFNALMLWELYHSLNADEKQVLTDAAKICTMKGQAVRLVQGELSNMKLTYPYDLEVAKAMLGMGGNGSA